MYYYCFSCNIFSSFHRFSPLIPVPFAHRHVPGASAGGLAEELEPDPVPAAESEVQGAWAPQVVAARDHGGGYPRRAEGRPLALAGTNMTTQLTSSTDHDHSTDLFYWPLPLCWPRPIQLTHTRSLLHLRVAEIAFATAPRPLLLPTTTYCPRPLTYWPWLLYWPRLILLTTTAITNHDLFYCTRSLLLTL